MGERIITTNVDLLDKAFHAIMTRMVETARAPTYPELGSVLGVGPDEALTVLHDLMDSGYPAWVDENDTIVTVCPLSNQPNRYRISVDGEQKWFSQ
jgi:hypothetical protein